MEERVRMNGLAAVREIVVRVAGRVGDVNAFAAERATVRVNMVYGNWELKPGLLE